MPQERKVTRGQPLRFPASLYNAAVDAVKWHRAQAGRAGTPGPVTSEIGHSLTILIENQSGTLDETFGVVRIGAPLLTAEDDGSNLLDRVAFEGQTPTTDDAVAILQEPAANGDVRRAVVSGITCAYVFMNDAGHQWANPVAGVNTYLESSADPGVARILWHGAGGNPPTDTELALVNLIGAGSAAAAATVSAWKEPVRVATTAAGTLATGFEDGDTIDGVVLDEGDRILVKNQSSGGENGVYVVAASGAPTRAEDADGGDELVGAVVWVSEGTANADTIWACTTDAPITVNTTSLAWVKVYPSAGSIEVEDTDESPTVASVTQLRFDSSDGFLVASAGAGVARVDLLTASPVQNGIVDNGLTTVPNYMQFWEGSKYVADTTFGSWFEMGIVDEEFYDESGSLGQAFVLTGSFTSDELVVRPSLTHRVLTGGTNYELSLQFDAENARAILTMTQNTTTPVLPKYGVFDPAGTGAVLEGITGTRTVKDGSGANKTVTISGGIITDWQT